MSDNELNKFKEQIGKIRQEYDELKREFDSLLCGNNKSKPRIIGSFTSAGVTIEKLLLYIIKKEGREGKLFTDDRKKRIGLNEYKNIVHDIIPKEQIIHINSVIQWRNHVAHGNNIDKVEEHELRAVNSALNSFVKWFFEAYLKTEFADFSKNEYANNINHQSHNFKKSSIDNKNPLNIPNRGPAINLKEYKAKKRRNRWIFVILLFTVAIFLLQKFYKLGKADNLALSNEEIKARITATLNDYTNDLNNGEFDAYKYFSSNVDTFYKMYHKRPKDINEYVNNDYYKEFQNQSVRFDFETLQIKRLPNNQFWALIIQYGTFFKTSDSIQYNNYKTRTELRFDENLRITHFRSFYK